MSVPDVELLIHPVVGVWNSRFHLFACHSDAPLTRCINNVVQLVL